MAACNVNSLFRSAFSTAEQVSYRCFCLLAANESLKAPLGVDATASGVGDGQALSHDQWIGIAKGVATLAGGAGLAWFMWEKLDRSEEEAMVVKLVERTDTLEKEHDKTDMRLEKIEDKLATIKSEIWHPSRH